MKNESNGSRILQIMGLIMLASGVIMLILGITGFIAADLFTGLPGRGIILLFTIIAMISALIEILAGFFALKFWDVPDKAGVCIFMGGVTILLSLVSMIFNGVSGEEFRFSTLIFGMIIPMLYLFGAVQLKAQE